MSSRKLVSFLWHSGVQEAFEKWLVDITFQNNLNLPISVVEYNKVAYFREPSTDILNFF